MKDTFYFQHDYNARNDPKLQDVLIEHGVAGIGVFWCVIEQIYEQGGKLPFKACKSIAFALHVDCKVVESVVQDFDFGMAETRAVKELSPYASGDFAISKITKAHIVEVIEDNTIVAPKFYKVKIVLVTLDERNGVEKHTTINILVQAESLKDAHDRIVKRMSSSMADYIIVAISETPIIEFYKWEGKKDEQHQD